METLIEILLELILQLFGDAIVDGMARSRNPVVRTVGYCGMLALFGGLLAALSLTFASRHLITDPKVRLAALALLPFANGALLVAIGARFTRAGRTRSAYEHFFPAFVFSAAFGLVRFLGAE